MLGAITTAWTSLITFLTGLFSSITSIFWNSTEQELTFIGLLGVIMAGVSICLLIFNLIRSFFPMRG